MKRIRKKILSLLLALMCIVSLLPTSVLAEQTLTAKISTESGIAGSTVNVTLAIEGNPGMSSFKGKISYDETLLTLNSVTYSSEFGGQPMQPESLSSPVTLTWLSPLADVSYNGVFATLNFTLAEIEDEQAVSSITMTYDEDDIYNMAETNLPLTVANGSVTIFNGIPGDINGDGKTNNKDATRLFQYLAGWKVEVDEAALDCNGDGKVNNKDATRLFQFVAGWKVDVYYGGKATQKCEHTLEAFAAQPATCTTDGNIAYWHCSKCNKYFSDADAKTEVTADSITIKGGHNFVGGVCTVCGERKDNCYTITYNIEGNDQYLKNIAIQNQNYQTYNSSDGIPWLDDLEVPGYIFEGWFDGQGSAASRVTSIPAGTARNIKLFAKWTKETYKITFDNSSMNLPNSSRTYTVDEEITLEPLSVDRYVFLGWTTDSDELISKIQPGTTGNFTLHSNWTSKRNLAKPVSKLGTPTIIEDTNEGKILFAYEIGKIENVPLYTIKDLPSAGGVVSVYTETTKKSISKTDATAIAKAVDHMTTDSTAWTLSEDWNTTTHIEDSTLEEHGYNRTTGQEVGKTSSNTYTLTTNEYDNTVVKANDGSVATTTQYDTKDVNTRETWESKASLSVSDTESTKYTDSANVSAEVGVGYGPVSAKIGAGMSTSTEISSSTTAGASTDVTIAHENTSNTKTGTDKVTVEDKTTTTTTDKGWSKSSNSSSSSSSSFTQYEEQTLSENIAKTYTYGQSYAIGGVNSKSADWSTSTGESSQYSSTVTYFNSEETTESVSYTIDGESDGSYRLVRAGVMHVFGVVIYDIANAEYSVATYNVLDDKTYTYIDYSATSAANFDDNENGVLPFEIPYFVNDYVNGRIVATEGLEYNNITGSTGDYSGSNTSVVIPEYITVDNKDGTHSAVTIRNLSAETVKGNTAVKSVLLSNYIREIPDSAFAGCTALQFVLGSEITSIGNYAFDGCTSLGKFKIPATVTSIGTNAFRDVETIEVEASSLEVVMGAIQSGAKNITINVSGIADELKNITLEIPSTVETFELQGGRKTYSGLQIKSDAGTTILNGITIRESSGIPLEISSEAVTLNQVDVESPSYVLLLSANTPAVSLYGISRLHSASGNAMVCRNVTISKIDSKLTTHLEVTGNLLYYGTFSDKTLSKFVDNGEFVELKDGEFDKYIKGSILLTFDSNGGSSKESTLIAYIGSPVGNLPTPTRDYYTFDGWYTEKDGGTEVTAETVFSAAADCTLYAHWTIKATSSWVKASNLPQNAAVVNRKYTYTQRSYKTSDTSSLSGWTKYDTKRTGWGGTQGPVYSNPSNGSRNVWTENYVSSSNYKTVYHYYCYAANNADTGGDHSYTRYGNCVNYRELALDYELPYGGQLNGNYLYNSWWYWKCNPYTTQQWVSDNYSTRWYYQEPVYTYYYYQDNNLESTAKPTGDNISNVIEWVQYRLK